MTSIATYPHGALRDSRTTSILRPATERECAMSLSAGDDGHISTLCYRLRPSTRKDSEPDVYALAGDGNWFATSDEAVDAAISLDASMPVDGGEWIVDKIEVVAYVEDR